MIGVLVSILVLIASVSVAYLLTIIDSIVHNQLYQFGLRFSYDWASPYWMILRISLALLGLIAVAASMNITFVLWKRLKRPRIVEAPTEEEEKVQKAEAARPSSGVPSLFRCTSCGRSITHPLRMLDFHSQRPKMVNICPFCNATVVPVSYVYNEVDGEAPQSEIDEEKIKKRIAKSLGG